MNNCTIVLLMLSVMLLLILYVRFLDITSKFCTTILGLVTYTLLYVQMLLSAAVVLCALLNCGTPWLSVISRLIINLTCDTATLFLSRVTTTALRLSDFTSSLHFVTVLYNGRSEVLTAVLLKIQVFWDVTPCWLVTIYTSTQSDLP
jgi:hypothetical protein